MPNPHPIELRERAVHAYLAGEGTYPEVAERFSIGTASLERWVKQYRETGSVEPTPKGGGWVSPVEVEVLETVIDETTGATSDEITREYNRRVRRRARVHRSSVLRAMHRLGYVFKKNVLGPPSKIDSTSNCDD